MTRFRVPYPADVRVLQLLDAAAAPLCVVCRASFREDASFVCAACRHEATTQRASEAA
jgi:hypothetical protein